MAVAGWGCKNTVAAIATRNVTIAFGQFFISNCSISGAAQSKPLRTHSFNVNLSFLRRKLNSAILEIGFGRRRSGRGDGSFLGTLQHDDAHFAFAAISAM